MFALNLSFHLEAAVHVIASPALAGTEISETVLKLEDLRI
jgi:hypothetical protein